MTDFKDPVDPSQDDTQRLRTLKSDPPGVKKHRLSTEAAVDVFTIACLTILLVCRAVPAGWEPHCFGAIVAIGGGAQLLQFLGKRGGVVVALISLVPTMAKLWKASHLG